MSINCHSPFPCNPPSPRPFPHPCFLSPWIYLLRTFHIHGRIRHDLLWWLLSPSIAFSGFILVVAFIGISLCFLLLIFIVWIYHILHIQSSGDGHLGYFSHFGYYGYASFIFEWTYIFNSIGRVSSRRIAESYRSSVCSLWRNCQSASRSVCTTLYSPSRQGSSDFPESSTMLIICLQDCSYPNGCALRRHWLILIKREIIFREYS